MSLICVAAGAGLYFGYQGLFEALATHWASSGTMLGVSAIAVTAALTLCRYRNDLLL